MAAVEFRLWRLVVNLFRNQILCARWVAVQSGRSDARYCSYSHVNCSGRLRRVLYGVRTFPVLPYFLYREYVVSGRVQGFHHLLPGAFVVYFVAILCLQERSDPSSSWLCSACLLCSYCCLLRELLGWACFLASRPRICIPRSTDWSCSYPRFYTAVGLKDRPVYTLDTYSVPRFKLACP